MPQNADLKKLKVTDEMSSKCKVVVCTPERAAAIDGMDAFSVILDKVDLHIQ